MNPSDDKDPDGRQAFGPLICARTQVEHAEEAHKSFIDPIEVGAMLRAWRKWGDSGPTYTLTMTPSLGA